MPILHSRITKVLHYSIITGEFTWLVRASIRVKVGNTAGYVDRAGYHRVGVDGYNFLAHRLAFFYIEGVWPTNEIDHVDRCRTNNTWVNLREATRSENMFNVGKRKNNTSGVKGVYWNKEKHKFQAQATVRGKQVYLGRYDSLDAAKQAFEKYVTPIHRAYLNIT